ncbi:4Fe-4S double cluster binding domain-containing protein [Clostridium ljungdahlii]|uniref:Epoxyqueuosine reductase n=1 Tax=Clostridium ljungdahlii TaxID=1538 RepID=A0A166R1F8_9CLOT|nr:4Fe-4S double cluster binding domain-containing protein [Clostridium ljungdahlii]OAA90567.1 Epoxyqueuosine reductase [Clostridium ljungdahlii]
MLEYNIQKILNNFMIDYYGVADISKYENELVKYGGSLVKGYPRAISLGIVFPSTIVDHLNDDSNNITKLEYENCYKTINARLDNIASIISSYIIRKGYKALPISAAERVNSDYINAAFSHKLAARLAGLGWIGKSCLLITPKHGPRVRWVSILTDLPLNPTGKEIEQKCGECMACVKICPQKAFYGKNYIEGEDREKRFDVKKCDSYFSEMEHNKQVPVCGMCVYICPYGRKNNK